MISGPRAGAALAALLGLLLAAALAADLRATQRTLQQQIEARSRDAAAVLAAALLQPGQDAAAWRSLAAAQFAAGHTRRLRLLAAGQPDAVADLQRHETPTEAPAWFQRLLPLSAAPATLALGMDGVAVGTLEIQADDAWAQDALWASFARTGLAAVVLGLFSLLGGAWAMGGRWPALRRQRARATASGDAAAAAASARTPAASQADAEHWRAAYAAQAEELADLQRQAQLDPVTGLTLRHHFLVRLQQRLDEPGGPGLALLIVRVLDLEATNLRLGHEATDRLLDAVADVLLTYVDRVPATLAGRLNGTDFALCLPVAGVAAETARSLRTALAATPALRASHTEVAVGGVDGLRDTSAGAALAAADDALARAEADGDVASGCVVLPASRREDVAGAGAWRERIRSALVEGRTQLAGVPVCGRDGRLLHLHCTLRVQLRHAGTFEPAESWRAAARRSRLLPQLDLAAVERALEDIGCDGGARAVQISRSSLAAPGFTSDVAAALAAAPDAARLLVLELVDDVRVGSGVAPVAAALGLWARLGVRAGVALPAGATADLPELKAAGVQYLKVDAGQFEGVAHDDTARGYVRGLLALAHDLGLSLLAGNVQDAADLQALWALGVHGACGPAVVAAAAAVQAAQPAG